LAKLIIAWGSAIEYVTEERVRVAKRRSRKTISDAKRCTSARRELEALFRVIRLNANVFRFDGGRFQPRLHDFRSHAAVHRIAAWYEQGVDAQELLPALGAYLGQLGLVSMNRHLLLTPEHYRKHLAAESKRRDSRKRVSNPSPLMVEFLKRIEIA
jgi:hypothetical protein